MIEQTLGWIGNIFFIYGVYALGKKQTRGFYFNAFANLLYAWQSVLMNNIPLFWLSIGLIVLNLKGIYEWSNSINKKHRLRKYYKKSMTFTRIKKKGLPSVKYCIPPKMKRPKEKNEKYL